MQAKTWPGVHVPLITPFKDDYSLDEAGLRRLVNYYIEEEKCDGLVPCGTTGESPTLSNAEHDRVIEIVIDETRGRVPVMAGTGPTARKRPSSGPGTRNTPAPRRASRYAPTTTGPPQHGILAHFEAIAKATKLPLFIYNIPSRTGRLIEAKTMIALSKIDNIIGMKDACGDMMITMDIMRATRQGSKKFYVLCGEDALTFSMMGLGGVRGSWPSPMSRQGILPDDLHSCRWKGRSIKPGKFTIRPFPSCPGALHRIQPGPGQGSPEPDGAAPAGRLRLPFVSLSARKAANSS